MLMATFVAGCAGPAGSAGTAVRPPEQKAGEVLRTSSACPAAGEHGNPLIVDWDHEQHMDLEIALQSGVAVIACTGQTFKLVKGCKLSGGYGFVPTSRYEQVIHLDGEDELRTNLPFSSTPSVKLLGEVKRSSQVDVGLITVGRRMTSRVVADRNALEGTCDGATHFVQSATIGAFVLRQGQKGEIHTAAELFAIEAQAGSKSQRASLNKAGDPNSCRSVHGDEERPLPDCSAPVRIDLVAITNTNTRGSRAPDDGPASKPSRGKSDGRAVLEPEQSPATTTSTPSCPAEKVLTVEGKCTTLAKAERTTFQCQADNPVECATQCTKGHAGSCFALGVLALQKKTTKEGPAIALLEKACAGGDPRGCGLAGQLYANGRDVPKNTTTAQRFLSAGCNGGDLPSCNNLGVTGRQDDPAVVAPYKKACAGGLAEGCVNLAYAYLRSKVPAERAKGADLLGRLCAEGDVSGCSGLSVVRLNLECERGIAAKCEELGFSLKNSNPDLARVAYSRMLALSQAACDRGEADECMRVAALSTESSRGIRDFFDEKRRSDSLRKAVVLQQSRCDRGEWRGCGEIAKLYALGWGVPIDRAKSDAFFKKQNDGLEKQCDGMGEKESCLTLGMAYIDGAPSKNPLLKNASLGERFLRKACKANSMEACGALAADGELSVSARERAEFRVKSCDLGSDFWCHACGESAADAPTKIRFFTIACDKENPSSCEALGDLFHEGATGVPRDEKRAFEFYVRACKLESETSCDHVREQHAKP